MLDISNQNPSNESEPATVSLTRMLIKGTKHSIQ